MSDVRSMTLHQRLQALLDHLHLTSAHVATQMPVDVANLAVHAPERIASVTFAVPVRLDPASFGAVAARTAIVTGDSGVSVEPSRRAAERLPGSHLICIANYLTTGWSDIAKDRPADMAAAIVANASRQPQASHISEGVPRQGVHAGITFKIVGTGPALILMPFFLAASQWQPIVEDLARQFSVIVIGGAHIGGAAILEARASAPTYRAVFRTLVDLLDPPADAHILDVGCGSGALDRILAARLGQSARITAVDFNDYLLGEARALASAEGLADRIAFMRGSAEDLPFADNSLDCTFSVTVLEECNADRAIREMRRVTKPGGRIGIIVRAIDLPQWWNVDIPPALAAKVAIPPQSVGPGGVADRSLYARMLGAGLTDLVACPQLLTLDTPGNSVWRYREDHLLALLSPEELAIWIDAREKARAEGTLMQANPMHCAVARKPL